MSSKNLAFDLEHQYQLYLKRVKLDERTMHPQQKVQVKQAFFGACGQLLIVMRDDMGDIPDEMAVIIFESLLQQVNEFWTKEVERYKARNQ